MTTTIGIIEDCKATRNGLSELLSSSDDFNVAWTAGDLSQAKLRVQHRVDLVLLDINLPDGSGLYLIGAFKSHNPLLKVLVLTVHHDSSHALRAVQLGADGYLLKDDLHLVQYLHEVLDDRYPMDSRVTRHLVAQQRQRTAPDNDHSLSPRELQTLTALAQGLSYHQIADYLRVSKNTVPGYIKSIYRKLDVSSRSQAVYLAMQRGLIQL